MSYSKRFVPDLCANFEGCPMLYGCSRGLVSQDLFNNEENGRWLPFRVEEKEVGQSTISAFCKLAGIPEIVSDGTLTYLRCDGHIPVEHETDCECTE